MSERNIYASLFWLCSLAMLLEGHILVALIWLVIGVLCYEE